MARIKLKTKLEDAKDENETDIENAVNFTLLPESCWEKFNIEDVRQIRRYRLLLQLAKRKA